MPWRFGKYFFQVGIYVAHKVIAILQLTCVLKTILKFEIKQSQSSCLAFPNSAHVITNNFDYNFNHLSAKAL